MESDNTCYEEPGDLDKTIELKDLNQSNPQLEKFLRLSSVYYMLFVLIIGLPIWYASTTTYRADLPYDRIASLNANKLQYTVLLELVDLSSNFDKTGLVKLERELSDTLGARSKTIEGLKLDFKCEARKASDNERSIMMQTTCLHDFDSQFTPVDSNKLRLVLFDENTSDRFKMAKKPEFLNNLYLNYNAAVDQADAMNKITDVVFNQYLHENRISDFNKNKAYSTRNLQKKEDLKRINYDSHYEITFTLINSNPREFNFNWDIEFKIQKYFRTITNQLSQYVKIITKTQELYHSDLEGHQSLIKLSNDKTQYLLSPKDLSIITNIFESRVGSHQADASTINFITYLPTNQPLYILNEETNARFNSFLVPRWGGCYILNHLNGTNAEMETFLTQFFQIIDIDLHKTQFSSKRSKIFNSELNSYLLLKTLENLSNTINTLKSLSSLLGKISNMIIGDNIGKQVYDAVNSIDHALDYMQNGEIGNAFISSKNAFISSEKAFFDPSLLELLYFPEDQKFAIYIPLFIPVGLPLLLSLKQLFKWYKNKSDEIGTKTKSD